VPERAGAQPQPQGGADRRRDGIGVTLDEAVARAHPLAPRTGWRERGI
jgi:hypothetical protein